MTTTAAPQGGSAAGLSQAQRELLQRRLGALRPTRTRTVGRRPDGTPPRLSFAQERIWFMEQLAPGTAAYLTPQVFHFPPAADPATVLAAWQAVLARHEALWMSFPPDADGRPTVRVTEPHPVDVPVLTADDDRAAAELTAEFGARTFDLATELPVRALLLTVPGSGHRLVVATHHIATDGWSNAVLLRELDRAYRALDAGEPLPPTDQDAVRYGDHAEHQRDWCASPAAQEHLAYWTDRLAGVPVLDLPTDLPRPATQRYEALTVPLRVPAATLRALDGWATAHRATRFAALVTAWQLTLARFAGQWDFAVGAPVAGRSLPELDDVVGMFVNMLPLRCALRPEQTVDEALLATRDRVLEGLSHEQIPFEHVVQQLGLPRDPSRPPLFQVMVALQNYTTFTDVDTAGPDRPDAAAAVDWSPVDLPATRFELELHTHERPDGDLGGRVVAATSLYDADVVRSLTETFLAVLARLPHHGGTRIDELPLLSDRAARELDRMSDGGPAAGARDGVDGADDGATLVDLVDAGLRSHPDAAVVDADGRRVDLPALSARADAIAGALRARGTGRGDVVAVAVSRSVDLVASLLAVLRCGAAYLPLDTEYPLDRLAFMLEDAGAATVLCDAAGADALTGTGADLLDVRAAAGTPVQGGDPACRPAADDAAYVIYTSGSTGRPKGVVNEHRGIVARLRWMQQRFALGDGDAVLQKTPAGFDVSVWEFFWPLMTGADLVLAAPGGHRDPAHLRRVIAERGVTVAHFVPSMLEIFLSDLDPAAAAALPLRAVVCSGEELRAGTALRCGELLPQAELHNLYGPTEAAVDVTAWRCRAEVVSRAGRVPIGGPVPGTRLHVLDERGGRQPVGALGQLHIAGVQVARGYLHRPELTAERFVTLPATSTGGEPERAYLTGDRVRWRPDGALEFHGRLDGQVKLRGQRVELGEIEHVLATRPGVARAAAAVKEPTPGDVRLVGYLVPEDPAGEVDLEQVRVALTAALPSYMVPAHLVLLDALPLSPNGKLDRGALPVPETAVVTGAFVAPAPGIEQQIADVWQQVLGADRVGATDDFFALGGHSLLATQVVAKLRGVLPEGVAISVMDLFQHPTVAGLAALAGSDAPRERRLLHELTRGRSTATRSLVCVPYGGGSAVVYQPLADALPADHRLWSVAIPGHDVGLDEDGLPFDELAESCTREVLDQVTGPVVLYGHCGVGGALIVEMARRLEAAGREVEAVYVGGIFPFARARGRFAQAAHWLSGRAGNRVHRNWLASMGVDLSDLEPGQADRIITNMRRDGDHAEDHFTALLATDPPRLRAPIISVVGERDPITDYHLERYREWEFLTDRTAVVVLAEAGHFFLKYRAAELVEIVTRTHDALHRGTATAELPAPTDTSSTWWLAEEHTADRATAAVEVADTSTRTGTDRQPPTPTPAGGHRPPGEPGMRAFLAVATGQLVSSVGSQLAGWAIPIWILERTGSLGLFGLTAVVAFLPVIVTSPLAGALADRFDRRRVLLLACATALLTEAVVAGLVLAETSSVAPLFAMVMALAAAGTVQRITFTAAVPQLVPKRHLGHANGILGIVNGAGQLFVPIAAAGLYALIGLRGILFIDVASYVIALAVLAVVRFPDRLGRVRKESFGEQVFGGFRLVWQHRQFRAMNIFFAVGNLLYAPALLLTPPLVLAFGTRADVAVIAAWEAAGSILGGVLMAAWGGPARHRMRVNLVLIGLSGLCVAATGLTPAIAPIAAGVLGTTFTLGLANGIYVTLIQTKVPQRYHGRVFAVGQTLAWSTFPVGFLVVPLIVQDWWQPLMEPGGGLAGSIGAVIGTGPGRGVALAFVVFGLLMTLNAIVGWCLPVLRDLDTDVPDALPDDLVGLDELARTGRGSAAAADRPADLPDTDAAVVGR